MRRLKDIEIQEISLVDEPAVPKARFLIVKRNEEVNMPENEVELEKANLKSIIGQIQDALKIEGIPEGAVTILNKVIAELEKLDESYGYPAPQKELEKRGSKFSKENLDRIRKIAELAKELLDQADKEDDTPADYMARCSEIVEGITKILRGEKMAELYDALQELKETIEKKEKEKEIPVRKTEFPVTLESDLTLLHKANTKDPAVVDFQKRADDLFILSKILGVDPRQTKLYNELQSPISELRKAMNTAATGLGLEWVPTGFSADLIGKVEAALKVAALHPRVRMPTDPFKLPALTGFRLLN